MTAGPGFGVVDIRFLRGSWLYLPHSRTQKTPNVPGAADGAMFRGQYGWVATLHPNDYHEEADMADGKMEEMKGKAKEKLGEIRNDDEQRDEGRAEQASGKVDQAKDKIGDAVDDIKDAFRK